MANSSIHLEIKTPSSLLSKKTPTSNNSSLQPATRSDPNCPNSTTFYQADTSSFKQVVQMLTGTSQTGTDASALKGSDQSQSRTHHIPPVKPKQSFKLYERRNSFKNFKISPLLSGLASSSGFNVSPRKHEILSLSVLDFPSLALSPVTPLVPEAFTRLSSHHSSNPDGAEIDSIAEDRAIAEKGFSLHKSPAQTPRESEPKLLPLFPVTSSRMSNDAPLYFSDLGHVQDWIFYRNEL